MIPTDWIDDAQQRLRHSLSQVLDCAPERLRIRIEEVTLPGKTGVEVYGEPPLTAEENAKVLTWLSLMNAVLGGSPILTETMPEVAEALPSRTFNVPMARCPTCGYKPDQATNVSGNRSAPHEGDFSICFGCGEILRFNLDLTLRTMSDSEFEALDASFQQLLKKSQDFARGRKWA